MTNIYLELTELELNLDKIFALNEEDKRFILDSYSKLINNFNQDGTIKNIPLSYSVYNTFISYGYLVPKNGRREKNLDKILGNENNI